MYVHPHVCVHVCLSQILFISFLFSSATSNLLPFRSSGSEQYLAQDAVEIIQLALEERECPLVVGVELGGFPTKGDWESELRPLIRRAQAGGLKVALHSGEDPSETKRGPAGEDMQMLDCNPDRLGHCVYVNYPPFFSFFLTLKWEPFILIEFNYDLYI